ncbi:MAG: fumarylacetoacetase, partial [Burkholderia vietnamiensis]|nr:fumarylacetoacetase [Burkholderia vietnamiensis]
MSDTRDWRATLDPARKSWVDTANDPACDFPIQNLPFGIFSDAAQ